MTRAELYAEAKRRDVSGRSRMSKADLEKALGRWRPCDSPWLSGCSVNLGGSSVMSAGAEHRPVLATDQHAEWRIRDGEVIVLRYDRLTGVWTGERERPNPQEVSLHRRLSHQKRRRRMPVDTICASRMERSHDEASGAPGKAGHQSSGTTALMYSFWSQPGSTCAVCSLDCGYRGNGMCKGARPSNREPCTPKPVE